MDLSLQIKPTGNTTAREISAASEEIRQTLERLPGVAQVAPRRVPGPDGAKSGLVKALGELAISLAPTALKEAMQVLLGVLVQRPHTKVLIESKDSKFSFEFDPKRVSLQELVAAAERLRGDAPQPS
jgi:hypothetical protein